MKNEIDSDEVYLPLELTPFSTLLLGFCIWVKCTLEYIQFSGIGSASNWTRNIKGRDALVGILRTLYIDMKVLNFSLHCGQKKLHFDSNLNRLLYL